MNTNYIEYLDALLERKNEVHKQIKTSKERQLVSEQTYLVETIRLRTEIEVIEKLKRAYIHFEQKEVEIEATEIKYKVINTRMMDVVFQSDQLNECAFYVAETHAKIFANPNYYETIVNGTQLEDINRYALMVDLIVTEI